jgi:probable HAF family extracellular repeat protein
VVGDTGIAGGADRAFVWSASTGMMALGTLGGKHSNGRGINNVGQVVGFANTPDNGGNDRHHAFIWSPAVGMRDLGTLGGRSSEGEAINDNGSVVGNAYDADGVVQPFIYDGTTMHNLNDLIDPGLGWRITLAHDINNSEQIVATGTTADEPWQHALMLTPIPEPAALPLLLVLGASSACCTLPRDVGSRFLRARRSGC